MPVTAPAIKLVLTCLGGVGEADSDIADVDADPEVEVDEGEDVDPLRDVRPDVERIDDPERPEDIGVDVEEGGGALDSENDPAEEGAERVEPNVNEEDEEGVENNFEEGEGEDIGEGGAEDVEEEDAGDDEGDGKSDDEGGGTDVTEGEVEGLLLACPPLSTSESVVPGTVTTSLSRET